MPHVPQIRNKRVTVFLKDGTRFEDVFVERKKDCVFLRGAGRLPLVDVRAISITRGNGDKKTKERPR